jgi:hypothetical protein
MAARRGEPKGIPNDWSGEYLCEAMKPREMLSLIVCTATASIIATYITRAIDATLRQVARLCGRALHVFLVECCIYIFVPLALAFGVSLGLGDVFIMALGQGPVVVSFLLAEAQIVVFCLVWLGSLILVIEWFEYIEQKASTGIEPV